MIEKDIINVLTKNIFYSIMKKLLQGRHHQHLKLLQGKHHHHLKLLQGRWVRTKVAYKLRGNFGRNYEYKVYWPMAYTIYQYIYPTYAYITLTNNFIIDKIIIFKITLNFNILFYNEITLYIGIYSSNRLYQYVLQ